MVVLETSIYNSILRDIQGYNGLSLFCKSFLEEKYPNISPFTIGSILSTQLVWRMKSYLRSKSSSDKYYREYKKCREKGEASGILLRFSTQFNLNPTTLARAVLKSWIPKDSQLTAGQLFKDTTLIQDPHLAYEVYLCSLYDNEYGHFGNTIKQCIGQEYEQKLELELRSLGISFIDEQDLRTKGYDKTPDFKLILPIAIDGFVINWIESKALFGDDVTHSGYLKDQLLCYWNRFGPGLVIYWFGYLDIIENTPENKKMIILRDKFPNKESITTMNLNIYDT